jgi:O-antigen biosynthesis protein
MMISVITPTHRGIPTILDAYESLRAQTYADWQWVIVPNNGAQLSEEMLGDPRIRVVPFTGKPIDGQRYSIGALKHFACDYATGGVYLELDDDDVLSPDCLATFAEVYQDPSVQAAYGNVCTFRWPSREPVTYSGYWGWQYKGCQFMGQPMQEAIAWPPGPWSLRHIYWSPNHPRSWRAAAYHAIGGHDPKLDLVDDHDLNIRMYLTYGAHGVRHIDRALYGYRLFDDSTCKHYSAEIRRLDAQMYVQYIERLAMRWARDNELPCLDLGGALAPRAGYTIVDREDAADVVCDLNDDWPFPDNSVGVARASHVFEHLYNPIHTMNELYRVLAPGGFALIEVPSTDGRGAWQDPTHVSYWNENSFWYYTRRAHAAYIPGFRGRFQASDLRTYFPSKWWQEHNIPVVRAHLIALKPGYEERHAGEVLI